MRILITGGAGFIGSALVRMLIEQTESVVLNFDKLTYASHPESLAGVADSERYHFVQADICDRARLDLVLQQFQPDLVMHLAAESHVDRSIEGPAAFIQTNIVGTYTLLEASRRYLVKPQLMIRARLIQQVKLQRIIWFVLGIELMLYR